MQRKRLARATRSPGFTLVELLIVIAIVMVLIAILMPALSRARMQALLIACQSNLRQIGQAAEMYSDANNGFVVPAGYAPPTNSGVTGEVWASILIRTGFVPRSGNVYSTSLTAPPTASSIFLCPAGLTDGFSNSSPTDPADPDGAKCVPYLCNLLNPSDPFYVYLWYGINATTQNYTPGLSHYYPYPARRLPDDNNEASYLDVKMVQIPHSAMMAFMFDGVFMNLQSTPLRINARHGPSQTPLGKGSFTNVLFFDDHVEALDRGTLPQSSTDMQSVVGLTNYPYPKWRMDQ